MENFIWSIRVMGLVGIRNFDVFVGNSPEGWFVSVRDVYSSEAIGAEEFYESFDDAVGNGYMRIGRALAAETKEL